MDHSTWATLTTCAKKYELSSIKRIAEDKNSQALTFGTAWHKVTEAHGRLNVPAHHANLVDHVLEKLQWVDPVDDYRTADKLRRAYERWVELRARYYKWRAVEAGFYADVGHDEPYEGRVDASLETDVNQGRGPEWWIVDYKTTGRLDSDWTEQYGISHQFKGYYAYGKAMWPDTAGVLIDLFHCTKGNKSGKTEGEREGIRFYQLPLRFTDEEIAATIQEYGEALALKKFYAERGVYPRNTSACRMYGRTCGFIDICGTADKEQQEQLIASFPPNTFSPHGE